jgi:hypothetical protein
VPLKDSALVTLQEAQAFLGSGQDANARLQDAINQASDIIEAWCHRPLRARTFTGERVEGPTRPMLYPKYPLGGPIDRSKPITITVDGVTQTVWRSNADGEPSGFDVAAMEHHFFRPWGWRSCWSGYTAVNLYNVVLSFTGGYDPVPDNLKLACFYVLQRIFAQDQQRGMTEVSSLTHPGGSLGFAPRDFVMPGSAVDILRDYEMPAVT